MYIVMAEVSSKHLSRGWFLLFSMFSFASVEKKIIPSLRNHILPGSRWIGGANQEPQEMFSTLQGSAILENHDTEPLLAADPSLGFIAVSGYNL